MSTENFVDTVETVDAVPAPETAPETAQKSKRVVGRPFTKETSAAAQINATRAKRMRKLARAKMLQAMCNDLDVGKELIEAVKSHDEERIRCLEHAIKIVGLHHDQSCEALAQRFEVKSDTTIKGDGAIKFVIEDAKTEG